MSYEIDNLTNLEIDIIKEIGSIGAGNAATSLSKMLNKRINMNVPIVQIFEFYKVSDIIGRADTPIVGVYLEFFGDIRGTVLFVLFGESALKILNLLLERSDIKDLSKLGELEISALKEVANILAGSYLGSLATLTGLKINYSVPDLAIDMAGAILAVPVIEFSEFGDKVLFIESHLIDGLDLIQSYFFMIPDTFSYKKIINSLEAK